MELCVKHATFVFNYSTHLINRKEKACILCITQWTFSYDDFLAKLKSLIHVQKWVSFVTITFLLSQKMVYFMKSISIFYSSSILKQHQYLEPAWQKKSSWSQECEYPSSHCLYSCISVGQLLVEGWQIKQEVVLNWH